MIVGIDLGTTNSLVGVWTDEGTRLIPNALGEHLTPSAVGIDAEGRVLVGAAARDRMATHPELTCAAFKRYMGSDREIALGKRRFRPEELSALVLRSLVDDVAAATGERPAEAVISVPAYFSDAQRKATRAAGELAGLRVERLINEPTAAALAYGLEKRAEETKFLVFDLGGGTFDVSILEMFEGVMEVRASAGDNFLGGEDFVEVLQQLALSDLRIPAERVSAAESAVLRSRLESAKRQLSGNASVELALRLDGRDHAWRADAERFEAQCAPLLQRLRTPVERALRDSRIEVGDLAEVVLVGGATRMPMIGRLVARMFGRLPLRHIDPDRTIALGAAAMAGMKSRHAAFDEVVMTDVCPYTLGVETATRDATGRIMAGQFSPIIERNTVIPASRAGTYFPMQEGQDRIELKVFQGESPRTVNNVALGQLEIPMPRRPVPECGVEVRFTYDVNGLLEVDAHVLSTGERHALVIERNPGVLTPKQIAERRTALAALKVHPRDAQANVAAIARAERLYEELLGDARGVLQQEIERFRAELDSQDPSRVDRARRHFAQFLDSLEPRSPL
jgi:molecular chaperone HscC